MNTSSQNILTPNSKKLLYEAIEEAYKNPSAKNSAEVLSVFDMVGESVQGTIPRQYPDFVSKYFTEVSNAVDIGIRPVNWKVASSLMEEHPIRMLNDTLLLKPSVPILGNVLSRMVVRSRLLAGSIAISPNALHYLYRLREYDSEYAMENSVFFGWGVDHPTYPVRSKLSEYVRTDPDWVRSVLKHMFYADQHAAQTVFMELLDSDTVRLASPVDCGATKYELNRYLSFVLGSLEYNATQGFVEYPLGMSGDDSLSFSFQWDSDVKESLSEFVVEKGILPPETDPFEELVQ